MRLLLQFQYYNDGHHCAAEKERAEGGAGDVGPEDDRLLPENGDEIPPKVQVVEEKINVLKIALKIKFWIVSVFVNFMVTLAVFPAITTLVVSTKQGQVGH